jgi:16S rRNA processing protein RimM
VTVILVSDRPERCRPGAVLYADGVELSVQDARPHRDGWLFRFVGVTDRTGAEALRGTILRGDRLDGDGDGDGDDTLWVHELVGAKVVDVAGREHGRVTAIQANPAHDLLVLEGGALVPLPFVVARDAGTVVIDPPDGLFE